MTTEHYNYQKGTEYDFGAPIRRAFDITPSANEFAIPTRAIMVSASCTVSGIFVGETTSHTTLTLEPGILYPFAFKVISAVSASATVKGYA